ncbi:MAG TPA: hypothetical protein VHG71_06080 [Verrucomicrobiae bacterium]|nr:hypothetical protein [Verrucomicrobiae bacterium]
MNSAAELIPAKWTRARWLLWAVVIFAAHIALIFVFASHKKIIPRAVTVQPQLFLADNSSDLIALGDPTMFVLPQANDFASAIWRKTPPREPPSFRWTEPPRWLPLAADDLGSVFLHFMQTNQLDGFQLNFKIGPRLNKPVLPALPQTENSTLQITGDLANRRILNPVDLPSLPCNDVIAPDKVQVLVDANGNVVSAILLPSPNSWETAARAAIGDTNALAIARAFRFAPSPRPTVGELIFNWRTVPLPATNAPANSP